MNSSLARAIAVAVFVAVTATGAPLGVDAIMSAQGTAWPLATHFYAPAMAFSSDGRYLALTASVGPAADYCLVPTCTGRLDFWDLSSGQRIFSSDTTFARIMSVVFTHDNRYLVTGHADGAVRVWSIGGGLRVVTRFGCCDGTWIRALALSPDDSTLAIGAQGGQLVLWKIADQLKGAAAAPATHTLIGHYFGISSLVFDSSGDYLISSADDQHVRRWNVRTGAHYEFQRAPGLLKAHRGMVKTVVLLDGGRQALSGSYWEGGTIKDYQSVTPPDHILRLWDVDKGVPLRSYPLTWGIRCCIQVLARNRVAFLKAQGWDEVPILQFFNLDSGTVEREVKPTMGETFHALAMRPDRRWFAIAIGDGHVLLWDAHTGRTIAQLVSVEQGWAVLAADGRMDFSDGFTRWPCAHNIQQACAGGGDVRPVHGLLAELMR